MLELILCHHHLGAFRMIPVKRDSVKGTFCGTDTTADTFIRIYYSDTTSQTSGRLDLHLFFCQCLMGIPEGIGRNCRIQAFYLSRCVIITFYTDIVFIQFDEFPFVSSDGHMAALYITVQGFRRIMSLSNGINGELRSGINITAYENIRFCSLEGQGICYRTIATAKFYLCVF